MIFVKAENDGTAESGQRIYFENITVEMKGGKQLKLPPAKFVLEQELELRVLSAAFRWEDAEFIQSKEQEQESGVNANC